MKARTWTCLGFLLFQHVSFSSSQVSLTGNFDIVNAINSNGDENVTATEVTNFYYTFGGGEAVSRCHFSRRLVEDFGAKPRYVNALFDFMQTSTGEAWRELSLDEFRRGIAGGSSDVKLTTASARLKALNDRIELALKNPKENKNGQNNLKYSDFQVAKWANQADSDGNNVLRDEEVSWAIRSLDMNHDFGIQRCEFIDQMMSKYNQPPITSNLMFDILFPSQEVTWADKDTLFLLLRINGNDNSFTLEEDFVKFMRLQNARAAGEVIEVDGAIVLPDGGDHAMTLTFSCWSLIFGLMLSLLINQ